MVETLLEHGAKIDRADIDDGNTALMVAADCSNEHSKPRDSSVIIVKNFRSFGYC